MTAFLRERNISLYKDIIMVLHEITVTHCTNRAQPTLVAGGTNSGGRCIFQ
jgi:hypothetical protein